MSVKTGEKVLVSWLIIAMPIFICAPLFCALDKSRILRDFTRLDYVDQVVERKVHVIRRPTGLPDNAQPERLSLRKTQVGHASSAASSSSGS